MIVAARTGLLSPWVHGVDGTGAMCGAVPARGARFRRTERLPINCPRCLMRMGSQRWALCEVPTASSRSPVHVRRVGPEGISLSGSSLGALTLCNLPVGWDLEELSVGDAAAARLRLGGGRLCGACERMLDHPLLDRVRDGVLVAQR